MHEPVYRRKYKYTKEMLLNISLITENFQNCKEYILKFFVNKLEKPDEMSSFRKYKRFPKEMKEILEDSFYVENVQRFIKSPFINPLEADEHVW